MQTWALPNLHTYLGIKNPDFTLLDILENRVPVEGGLLKTTVPDCV